MGYRNANTIGIIFVCLHGILFSCYAVPVEQTFYFDVEEVQLMQESRRSLVLLGEDGISFFQQFQCVFRQESTDERHQSFCNLCDFVASGQRIIDLDDVLQMVRFVQNSCADEHLKQEAHSFFSKFKVAKVVIDGKELPCELFLCHDVDARVSGGVHTFQKPFQTVSASLAPKHRRLLIGTLFVSDYVCVEGEAAFARPVEFLDDIRVAEDKKLYVDKLEARTCDAPLQFSSDLCIDEKNKLFVDIIKPKTKNGAVHVRGDLDVCCSSDLTVHGRLIVPGELVVSTTGDVLIKEGNCLFVNCIRSIDNNGTTTIGNVGVSDGKQLLVNKIVPIDANNNPHLTGTTQFCGNVCIDADRMLSVDSVQPKTTNGRIAQGDTTLESVVVTQGVDVGTSVIVDRIDPRTQGSTAFRSICIDVGMTLSVDSIQPKTPNGSISIPGLALNSANIAGDVSVTGSVVVGNTVVVDRIEPQSSAATQFVSVCIDPGMTLSVDKICAKTTNGPIDFCDDICVEIGNKISVDTLSAKTLNGTINITDNVCVVPGKRLSVDVIDAKIGATVVIDDNLTVNGSVAANQYHPQGGNITLVGNVDSTGDISIPLGRNYFIGGTPLLPGFANPAVVDLNMNRKFITQCEGLACHELSVFPAGVAGGFSFVVNTAAATVRINNGSVFQNATLIHSDERIKENIVSIDGDDALRRIIQLRPVTYTLKKNAKNNSPEKKSGQRGFIAQEVKKVIPELVRITDGIDPQGEEVNDFHYLNYIQMIAEVVAALQATHEKLEKAEARITDLEQRLNIS